MSRSFRKFPMAGTRVNKLLKRLANKRVRAYQGKLPDGKRYKHLLNSWDIRDYKGTSSPREHFDRLFDPDVSRGICNYHIRRWKESNLELPLQLWWQYMYYRWYLGK